MFRCSKRREILLKCIIITSKSFSLTSSNSASENKGSVLKEDGKSGEASTIVGATKEDLEALGVSATQDIGETVDLNDELAKKGGTMSMEDIMKLHGQ